MEISKSADEELEKALIEEASRVIKQEENFDDLSPAEQNEQRENPFQCNLQTHLDPANRSEFECKVEKVMPEESAERNKNEEDYFSAKQKHGTHPIHCAICNKFLRNKKSLRYHQKTHIDPANRDVFKCEFCACTFKSERGLAKHLATKHTAEFERKKLLMATHGPKIHVCTICGKNYVRLGDLTRHEVRCGVNELICGVCGKQFRQARSLKKHRKKKHLHQPLLEAHETVQTEHWEQLGRPRKVRRDEVDPEDLGRTTELQAENLATKETIIIETWNGTSIEEDLEVIREIKKGEVIIKDELPEMETSSDEVDHFGDDPANSDFGDVFGIPTAEEPTKAEVEATCGSQFPAELVIKLEKLDYAALPKPAKKKIRPFKSNYKNQFPRKECEHCGQTFAYQYRLAMHRVKEHGSTETPKVNRQQPKTLMPLNFHCDQCDRKFYLQSRLLVHKAKVHGCKEILKKPYVSKVLSSHSCKTCGKNFKGWGGLKYHLRFVHEQTIDQTKLARCPACRKTFFTAEEMAEHICLKVNVRKRSKKCDLCDKTYFRRGALEKHFGIHPEYQNVKCDECPKGFYNQRQLKYHKRLSHGKPVQCKTCHQMFKTKYILEEHNAKFRCVTLLSQ